MQYYIKLYIYVKPIWYHPDPFINSKLKAIKFLIFKKRSLQTFFSLLKVFFSGVLFLFSDPRSIRLRNFRPFSKGFFRR